MRRDLTERIDDALTNSHLITNLAAVTQNAMNALLNPATKPLKSFLNGTWLQHPLHPLLTDIPIGGWTVAVFLNLIALIFGVQNLGAASGIATGVGVLGALGAIVTGFADWMDIDPAELAVGITHATINAIATLLFAASFIVLWQSEWRVGPAATVLALLGYGLVTAGGFLGGTLVFRMGVMVNRDAHTTGPDDFVPVLPMQELVENKPVRVDAQGRPILLVRRGEEVNAIGAICSHYGAPLEEGQLKDGTIECPWHGSRFCLADGRVQAGPATAPVPAYEVRIRNNQIEVKEK